MRVTRLLVGLIAAIAGTGCTTMADSIAAKGTGPYRIYAQPADEVWPVVVDAISDAGLELISENRSAGQILAQRGMTAMSYGENVAIFVEDHADNRCRVEIVSKRVMGTNVFAPDWSDQLFSYLDAELERHAETP